MFYLYARDVSQGIYWRHQVFTLHERPWQCISQFESLAQHLKSGEALQLIWIATEPEDLTQMTAVEEWLIKSQCQLLVIYPKESTIAQSGLSQRLSGHTAEYNEVNERSESLKTKLEAPITRLKTTGAPHHESLMATLPIKEAVSPLAENSQPRAKRFNWFTPNVGQDLKRIEKANGKALRARVAVMGEDYGAYELAGAASQMGSKTAVLDLNRFAPSMDLRMGISPHISYQYLEVDREAATGLYVLMDCAKLAPLDWETVEKCSQKVSGFPNLYCITGLYQLSDFEYFSANDLERVLEGIGRYFDLVVLRINSFPYDGFTMKALHWADYILQVSPWDMTTIRAYKQLVSVLREKQQIREDKHGLILVESEQGESVALSQWITGVNVLGKIPWSKQRNQNSRYAKAYFRQLDTELRPFYERIVAQLEVACGTR